MNRFEKALNLNNTVDTNEKSIIEVESIDKNINSEIILKNSSSETIQTSIRLKKDLMAILDSVSKRTGRSRNYIINYLIEEYLKL